MQISLQVSAGRPRCQAPRPRRLRLLPPGGLGRRPRLPERLCFGRQVRPLGRVLRGGREERGVPAAAAGGGGGGSGQGVEPPELYGGQVRGIKKLQKAAAAFLLL